MYCRHCGTPNDDNAFRCVQCGKVVQDVAAHALAEGSIPNYLVGAILTTVFCCMPSGVVAIVYAAQVNPKLYAGDREGALAASNNAKIWTWVSFGLGLLIVAFYALLAALGFMGELK